MVKNVTAEISEGKQRCKKNIWDEV